MTHIESIASSAPSLPSSSFQISEAAARRIVLLLADEKPGTVFRVTVLGGGCSGFQYQFDLDPRGVNAEDKIFGQAEAPVAVDEISLDLLKGGMLDYAETLGSAGFLITNPNATARCGCGNSFSV